MIELKDFKKWDGVKVSKETKELLINQVKDEETGSHASTGNFLALKILDNTILICKITSSVDFEGSE